MDTNQAIKAIRKELTIKDETLKAWKLLELFKDVPGLEEERKNTWGMMRHCFEHEWMLKMYEFIDASDCELIEPEEVITNPAIKFHRYAWMMKNIEEGKPKSYLDLGCYVGSLAMWAASKGVKAYGCDYTKYVIEVARKRAKVRGLDATFFQGDVRQFNQVKADYVSSFEVIEHIPEIEDYLAHLADLANEWVFVSTPDGPYGNGEGNVAQGWEWDGKLPRGHIRVFTHSTMRQLLKNYDIGEMFTDEGGLLCAKYRKKHGN